MQEEIGCRLMGKRICPPMMAIEPVAGARAKSTVCSEIIAELPMGFGRPAANAYYVRGIVEREVFAAVVDGRPRGLIALEYHFGVTCNIWWLGVKPLAHRHLDARLLGLVLRRV
jgi:hypothetical protein